MSVTDDSKDPIPHGLVGYRRFGCRCDDGTAESCMGANRLYHRQRRGAKAEQRDDDRRTESDEVAAQRRKRKGGPAISTKGIREAAAKRSNATESSDSMRIGPMEAAVVAESAELELATKRPTLVIAARNLAKIIDTPEMSSIHTSTTKQVMAIMAELRGDTDGKKATGKRKSGSRLATVGALTKVKRQGA